MSRTLIVGCSFVQNLQVNKNGSDFLVVGTSGAGNQSIAARVVYLCSKESFNQVIVVWSGVNRLDFPIPKRLHDTFPKDQQGYPSYVYYTPLDDMIWYHSGGFLLSGTSDQSPQVVRNFFQNQYRGSTPKYLSDFTLLSIIQTQAFLQQQQIPYQMSFIYDIDKPYIDPVIEPGCGRLDRTSSLNYLVDWKKFSSFTTAYEYGKNLGKLEDGFHLCNDCLIDWYKKSFGIELISLL